MKSPPAALLSPARIAKRSGSNFLVSFAAAAPERRSALTAIYAFCRVVDDAADDCADPAEGRAQLDFWAEELSRAVEGTPRTQVGEGVQQAIQRFDVRPEHLRGVIDGVAWDLRGAPMQTEAELQEYCYGVACCVGLACLPVFGATGEAAERYAVELGHALQLTNIARDLRGDAEEGRTYAPAAVLAELGVDPAWLLGGGPAEAYRPGGQVTALVEWLLSRARARYAAAAACDLDPRSRRALLPAEIMGGVYRELLRRLEALGGEVCRRGRRVRVPALRKLWIVRQVRRRVLAAADA